jgi:hypothetical protein
MAETATFDAVVIGSAASPGQLTVNSPDAPAGKAPGPAGKFASFHFDGAQGTLSLGGAGQTLRGVIKVGPTAASQSVLLIKVHEGETRSNSRNGIPRTPPGRWRTSSAICSGTRTSTRTAAAP